MRTLSSSRTANAPIAPSAPRRALLAIVAVAALAAGVAACGSGTSSPGPGSSSTASTAGFPVTLSTANGAVHVSRRPTAIISLSPTATEMLYAIGAGRQVKAVDNDSDYPRQAPRTKLSGLTPNVEAIVSYKPDLVVVSYDAAKLAKSLAAFSIPVLDLPAPANLKGVYTEFDQLGEATGHLQTAKREDATLKRQIAGIVASAPHNGKPLTYYYELGQDYYSITDSTFVGSLLKLLGMRSIADAAKGAAASGGYPQLSAEYILKEQPDYIILADTICCHQSAATVAARPGWSVLAAVKDHHIIPLNDDIASRWGPRIPDLLRAVEAGISGGS